MNALTGHTLYEKLNTVMDGPLSATHDEMIDKLCAAAADHYAGVVSDAQERLGRAFMQRNELSVRNHQLQAERDSLRKQLDHALESLNYEQSRANVWRDAYAGVTEDVVQLERKVEWLSTPWFLRLWSFAK